MPESTACEKNKFLKLGAFSAAAGVIAVYTLAVAWFSWKYYPIGQTRSVENDFFAWYTANAEAIARGDIFGIREYRFNPPGYSALLALAGLAVNDFFTAGKVISIVASVLALVCVYFLIKKTFDSFTAVLVTAATAANPYFFLSGYYVGTDMLFMALVCLAVLVLVSTDWRCGEKSLLAGFVAGLACLTRYNGIFLIPAGLGVFFLETSAGKRRRLCLTYLLSFAAVMLPWHLFLWVRRGSFFYNENYLNIAYDILHKTANKDSTFPLLSAKYQNLGEVILSEPGRFLRNLVFNMGNLAVDIFRFLVPEFLGPFALLGIVLLLKDSTGSETKLRRRRYFFLSAACYFLLMSPIHFEARYFLYLIPFLSLACLYGLERIIARVVRGVLAKPVRAAALAGMVLYIAWSSAGFQFSHSKTFNREILSLADFMKYVSTPSQSIMSRSANIAYFSGAGYRFLPVLPAPSALARYARSKHADFVFCSVAESSARPQLEALVNDAPWPGLQKIAEWRPSRRKAAIYRVLPDAAAADIFAAGRGNFATEKLWREFLRKTAPPANRISLEGVLIVKNPGLYTLVFSADKFSLSVDGEVVLQDQGSRSSFVAGTLALEKGFHFIRIEFSTNRKHVVPPGLYWQTPEGTRQAIPRSAFVINRVATASHPGA